MRESHVVAQGLVPPRHFEPIQLSQNLLWDEDRRARAPRGHVGSQALGVAQAVYEPVRVEHYQLGSRQGRQGH